MKLTASDVARICGVDLKTIHNWANKGKIPCSRTDGRHLRFRRIELIEFLRAYSFAVPDALRQVKPAVVIVDPEAASLTATRRALAKRFVVHAHHAMAPALVAVGAHDPDALVVDARTTDIDLDACVNALRESSETQHLRILVIDDGAVPRGEPAKLRELLEDATGIGRK